ncbi:hypothetical protein TRVL_06849 [Trypanosoma vivax]|nr:hypothetical protein TRVL_06849 [Trypanosoma vivax]
MQVQPQHSSVAPFSIRTQTRKNTPAVPRYHPLSESKETIQRRVCTVTHSDTTLNFTHKKDFHGGSAVPQSQPQLLCNRCKPVPAVSKGPQTHHCHCRARPKQCTA